jgi:hypothetical protein
MSFQLHIHLTDGNVFHYRQDDPPAIVKTIDALDPKRVFEQNQLMVHGMRALTGYRVANIEMLRVVTDATPDWPLPSPLAECREVDGETFERLRRDEGGNERDRPEVPPGQKRAVFMELLLRSGTIVYAEGTVLASTPLQERTVLQHILDRKYFQISMPGRGVVLINPANIIRYGLYPGPAHPPSFALDLHRM